MTRVALLRQVVVDSILWVVAAGLAVHLAYGLGWRVDVTDDGRHTLSTAAVEVAGSLRQPVVARAYLSSGLAAPYHEHRDAALQLLSALSSASGGRIVVVDQDPTDDPAVAAAAQEAGIRPVPYVARDGDRQEQRVVFLGVQLEQEGRRVVLDVLPSVQRMEYELVRALRAVSTSADERASVGWVVGHGEPDPAALPPEHPLGQVAAQLGLTAQLDRVTLDGPVASDVLLWVGPQRPVPVEAQRRVDEHLRGGGALVLFVGTQRPSPTGEQLVSVPHGLQRMLGHYGVSLGAELLVDRLSHEVLALAGAPPGPSVFAPVSRNLDRAVPAVRDLERVVLPFASAVAPVDPLPAAVHAEVWARSGGSSAALTPPDLSVAALEARLRSPVDGEDAGPHPVVTVLSGELPALFADAEGPQAPTRLAVVGSSDAAANTPELVLNLVDWALDDPALIAIRSRGGPPAPLDRPERPAVVKAALLTPGLVVVLGLLVLGLRRDP